ncbi:MAG: DUF3080 domain-containing protein [Aliidiomarina sp.]|uniref:DUF3080 family protein n=1 Tax=Aliidiomarina sp. TaxID=1872439 RepID=UPI0025BEDEC1|nr:DUF3080 family protein [Aliidiomarina sp.]MCH8500385.1 DUF3080 domain-containing protein [Aliidiomarina sp.]
MPAKIAASVTQKLSLRTALLLCFTVLLVGGCSRSSSSALSEYQARIARLTDSETVPVQRPNFERLPRVQESRSEIPEYTISLVASQRLNRCRAGQLIADRNSSLGRVQPPHLRLRHEIEMLIALPECLADADVASQSIAAELATAITHKQETLPLWTQRLLTTEPILRDALRPGRKVLGPEEMAGAQETLAALDNILYVLAAIDEYLDEPSQTDVLDDLNLAEYWQPSWQALGQSDFLPRYWRSQQHALGAMRALNLQLAGAEQALRCSATRTPVEAEYLHTVMLNFWIAELQPMFAHWNSLQQQLTVRLQQLQSFYESSAWLDYFEHLIGEQSYAAQLQREVRIHAEHWQSLLASCQLDPVSGRRN